MPASVTVPLVYVCAIQGPLTDAYVSMGTLDDARIHMGISLTLYDVCIH